MLMKRIVTAVMACLASIAFIALAPNAAAHAAQLAQTYVVKPGDTLLAIAMRFSMSITTLQAANNINDPDQLQIGQTLVIPVAGGGKASAGNIKHIVQAGDTLGAISLKYGANLNDVLRANKLNESSMLQIGQEIVVPGTTAMAAQPAAPAPAAKVELIPLTQNAAAQPAPAPTPIPLTIAVDGDINAMRTAMLMLYNKVRAENNLPLLSYSGVLEQSAQGHADDCRARGQGSHIGSDGTKPSQRIARAGYTGRITGENWAWARAVEKAFDMWYYQEIPDGPHLKNILNARYTEVGFGIAASNGGYYFIANFGAP